MDYEWDNLISALIESDPRRQGWGVNRQNILSERQKMQQQEKMHPLELMTRDILNQAAQQEIEANKYKMTQQQLYEPMRKFQVGIGTYGPEYAQTWGRENPELAKSIFEPGTPKGTTFPYGYFTGDTQGQFERGTTDEQLLTAGRRFYEGGSELAKKLAETQGTEDIKHPYAVALENLREQGATGRTRMQTTSAEKIAAGRQATDKEIAEGREREDPIISKFLDKVLNTSVLTQSVVGRAKTILRDPKSLTEDIVDQLDALEAHIQHLEQFKNVLPKEMQGMVDTQIKAAAKVQAQLQQKHKASTAPPAPKGPASNYMGTPLPSWMTPPEL